MICFDCKCSFSAECVIHGSASANVGDPAREVLNDACQDLMLMCQHVRSTFDKAVNDFKINKTGEDMDTQ
jgi:hypothetical protein